MDQCQVQERAQRINALRECLAAFEPFASKRPARPQELANALGDETIDVAGPVRQMGSIYLETTARRIEVIDQMAEELEAA